MTILARAVGRRKEAVAQVQLVLGTGAFIINEKTAESYLQHNSFSLVKIKSPFEVLLLANNNDQLIDNSKLEKPHDINIIKISNKIQGESQESEKNLSSPMKKIDTIVKVKGGGLIGQVDAIKLALTKAICKLDLKLSLLLTETVETIISNSENQANTRKIFKFKGFLSQDSRIKERRKYGLKKARKAPQYSKR